MGLRLKMMGYTYYKTTALIPDGHQLTRAMLFENLRQHFMDRENVRVEINDDTILKIQKGTWTLYVSWEDAAHVVEESKDMAARFLSNNIDQVAARSSSSRISTYADPDPKMEHFNDYVFVLEVFDRFPGFYVLEAATGEMRKT
jgi:hypothetical protein